MRMKNLTHWNHRINADVEKFGRDSFLFGVVEYCEKENLLDREQYYIDNWIPDYNLRKDVDDCKSSWDKESRIKLGEKLKLAWVERKASLSPEEFKKKHGDARRGILHSDESKKNMSEKRKGKPKTDEWKEKMRQSRLGTKLIDGKYIKISEVY
jgi:group I intron endonuclease